MSELFQEIKDDIRQENLERLWRHLGKLMVVVSVVVVAATVVMVIVQNHRQAEEMARTGQFITGTQRMEAGDYKGAVAAFSALADSGDPHYYGLAMLRKAQAQSAGGDRKGAAETYQALAAQDGTFGALAQMQADTGNIVTPDISSPFYYTMAEWRGWQLLAAGKKDEALLQFITLRDAADAPPSLRQRMQDVLSAMNNPTKDALVDAIAKDKK